MNSILCGELNKLSYFTTILALDIQWNLSKLIHNSNIEGCCRQFSMRSRRRLVTHTPYRAITSLAPTMESYVVARTHKIITHFPATIGFV